MQISKPSRLFSMMIYFCIYYRLCWLIIKRTLLFPKQSLFRLPRYFSCMKYQTHILKLYWYLHNGWQIMFLLLNCQKLLSVSIRCCYTIFKVIQTYLLRNDLCIRWLFQPNPFRSFIQQILIRLLFYHCFSLKLQNIHWEFIFP